MLLTALMKASALFLLCCPALNLTLPKPIGPYLVGTITLELLDTTRLDPLAPDTRYRDLMLSVFYPIEHIRRYNLAPSFSPLYASFLDTSLGIPPGLAESVTSAAYSNAYLHPSTPTPPNLLLFSPGYGNGRQDYTATLTNLASQGYIVIAVDHPFDSAFIEYPKNRTAIRVNETISTPEDAARTVNIRVQDLSSVLNFLSTNATFARQIPGVHGTLDVSNVGVFGHSLGGAASASAMAADSRFACGINFDGSFWGSVVQTGLERPFFLMASAVHNQSNDASWASFVKRGEGEKLEVSVRGSMHGTFEDFAVLYDEVIAQGGSIDGAEGLFGSIGGGRMLDIVGTYAGAWFGRCLEGKRQELLDGPSGSWPEVEFWDL